MIDSDEIKYNNWLDERNSGIGGSEAAAIVGMNPYMTNTDLFDYKTGLKERKNISNRPEVIYGKKAERPLIELFALDYPEYEVIIPEPFTLKRSKKNPFILGTLDGELIEKETGRKGILEIKTTNIIKSMAFEKWNNKIPDNYYIQVIHYFLLDNYDFAFLKAQLKTVYKDEIRINTRHYKIERSEKTGDIDFLEKEEIKFWNENIIPRKRPNLILPNI